MNKFAPLILAVLIALAGIQVWSSRAGENVRAGDGIVSDADLRKETTTTLSQRTFVPLAPLPETSSTTIRIRRPVATTVPTTTSDGEPVDPDGDGGEQPGGPGENPDPDPTTTDPGSATTSETILPPETSVPTDTQPPETDPAVTEPPVTDPPTNEPPIGGGNGRPGRTTTTADQAGEQPGPND